MYKSIKELDIFISDGNYSSKYPRSDEFVDEGIPFIRGNNMIDGEIVDEDMYHITEEKHGILLKGHVKSGDVLITTRGNIGQVAIVPERHNDSNINAQIVLLRVNNKELYNRYLLWALQSHNAKEQYLSLQTGTALKQLPVGKLEQVKINCVDLKSQFEIAEILDRAYQIIKIRKKELEALDDLIKARFVELFGDLASPECKWNKEKLVDTCVNPDDIKCGPFGTQLSKDEYVGSGIAVWDIPQINSSFSTIPTHFLTKEKAKQLDAYSIKPGDIAMSRKGNVGKCAVFPSSLAEGIIHSDVLRIRVDDSRVLPMFMMHQLHYSDAVQHQIELVSSGAIMAGINVTKLKQIFVHIPPMELQEQFADFVHQSDKSKVILLTLLEIRVS